MYRGIAWRGIVPVIRKQPKSYHAFARLCFKFRFVQRPGELPRSDLR